MHSQAMLFVDVIANVNLFAMVVGATLIALVVGYSSPAN